MRKQPVWHVHPMKDSNQATQMCSLIRVSLAHMKKLCILGCPKCAHWRFWSACTNVRNDLIHWVHMSGGTFSDWDSYIGEPTHAALSVLQFPLLLLLYRTVYIGMVRESSGSLELFVMSQQLKYRRLLGLDPEKEQKKKTKKKKTSVQKTFRQL